MPYKVFEEGDEWCVYRVDADGEPIGKTLGCHDSEAEAEEQVKALYANEPQARAAVGVHHTATDGDMEPPELRDASLEIERRSFPGQVRAIEREGRPIISGYAAVFGQVSEALGGFREVIEPGAFSEAILNDDVRALFNHDPNVVLGRTPKTLRLREDENGLYYEIDPPDTQAARDLLVSLRRGDISQSSFGFTVTSQQWDGSNQDYVVRRIKSVRLFDVSPVTFPAYPTTSAEARAMAHRLSRRATAHGRSDPAGRLDVLKRKLKLIE